jgi:hypothetical protein
VITTLENQWFKIFVILIDLENQLIGFYFIFENLGDFQNGKFKYINKNLFKKQSKTK